MKIQMSWGGVFRQTTQCKMAGVILKMAVAQGEYFTYFPFFFSRELPALSKTKPENKKTILGEGGALPCQFCRLPSPPLPLRSRKNWRRMYSPKAIPAMQRRSRGAKLAHAAASRDFCLGFFSLQNRAYSYPRRVDKKPISVAPISPPAPSSKPLDTPLLPARPFSQRPSEGARGVCIVAHHVRGQGKDGGGGAARRSPSHRRRR